MRRMKSRLLILALWAFLLPAYAEASWVFVQDSGDSGWQRYSRSFQNGFSGTVGFVVSNEYDDGWDSFLLLDNLSHGAQVGETSNKGFELNSYAGYSLSGYGSIRPGPINGSYWGGTWATYYPTQGSRLSLQESNGANTSAFLNYYGEQGYNGSILETQIVVPAGQTFTFDWAFMTTDEMPYHDFSLVYFKNDSGEIVFEDGLGQLGVHAPLPASVLLLASGLAGLAGFRKMNPLRHIIRFLG